MGSGKNALFLSQTTERKENMSKRKEILRYCKYYGGEKENPKTDYYERLFWDYEASFMHKFESGFFGAKPIDEAFSDYMIAAFEHLAEMHDTMDNGEFYRDKYFSKQQKF